MPEDDFVTLKIIQTMLEMQATAYKDSFKMMFEGGMKPATISLKPTNI